MTFKMSNARKIFLAGSLIASVSSCKPDIPFEEVSVGSADFSRYVAVGNSLTAGYADYSLYRSGQINSYPNILATQFKPVGGGDFKQPLVPGDYGWPDAKLVLGWKTNCAGERSLVPIDYAGPIDTAGSSVNIASTGPYNNIGVPGIRVVDYLLPGYANIASSLGNADFAKRFFKDPAARPLDELEHTVSNINPTFFTLWLGSNDVLAYATAGGEGAAPGTPLSGLVLPDDIPPVDLFRRSYDSIVNNLVKNGAKGVVINIPDITSIPLFTTIPIRGLKLTYEESLLMNIQHADANLSFAEGENFFIIEDEAAAGGRRLIMNNEFILLSTPTDSLKCAGWGKTKPIPKEYVLTVDEVNNIKTSTAAFNQIIADAAQQYDLAYLDVNSFLKKVVSGIKYNGVEYSTEFVGGGAFSLDGIHLTPRGNAIVANEIIRITNSKYGSTLPAVDVNNYSGIRFP